MRGKRPATPEERQILLRFPGFGPVALGIFPTRSPGATPMRAGSSLEASSRPS